MSSTYPPSVFKASHSISRPEPIVSANLAAVRSSMRAISAENRWVMAGLVLAMAMVVAFYMILVDNIAHLQTQRQAEQLQAQERHRCGMLMDRLEREQCLASLSHADDADAATVVAER